jgi:hypothetical protein
VHVVFRTLNGLMAVLFAIAVVVQFNDPDPTRWIAIYGAALAVSILAAVRGGVPVALPVTVGPIALAWGLLLAGRGGATPRVYQQMFDAWEMKNTSIEEAREATGLLIVFFWMVVVGLWPRFSARSASV